MAFDPHLEQEMVEDMITLRDLTQESLLKNLMKRYNKDLIYTYTGSILVSLNPFQFFTIYGADYVKRYVGKRVGAEPPHIFAMAEAAYTYMREAKRDQSLIISGESGSGKTEATKLILQYLAAMTNKHSEIEQMILESSPVLEAFGNAKTVRNNNSSRFGKFMKVQFSQGAIAGATITQYLLEKSRIVYQAPNERNYHVFYMLFAGFDDNFKTKYKLTVPEDFKYINQSGCIFTDRIPDKKNYSEMMQGLNFLGLDEPYQDKIFKIVCSVLWLGNTIFEAQGEGSKIKDSASINIIAGLLSVNPEQLALALTKKTVVVRGQKIVSDLSKSAAEDTRDALAKALYSRCFEWLVVMINKCVEKPVANPQFIGILDIFGFENFKINSFEQLCINYANEKLQQHFNQHIFKLEQAEYEKEQINWSKIKFNDNQHTINLIESNKPPGILALLDEECRFPKATDKTFLEKIVAQHTKHESFSKPKRSQTTFIVVHYAGDVEYQIDKFLDKNKDTLQMDLNECMRTSSIDLLKEFFKEEIEDESAAASKKTTLTVGRNFKNQLIILTDTLSATQGHYVRCIKPNSLLAPSTFDSDMVLAQLRYAGMLETIKIRRNGYPIRYPVEEFWKRYLCLCPGTPKDGDYRKGCLNLCPRLKLEEDFWQVGVSKVFLKDYSFNTLEDRRNITLSKFAIIVQAWWRMIVVRDYFREIKGCTIVCQKTWRGYIARKRYLRKKEAALTLQTQVRMFYTRKRFLIALAAKREEERRKREEEERLRREEEERRRREEEERRKKEEEEIRERIRKGESEAQIRAEFAQRHEAEAAKREEEEKKVEEAKQKEEEKKKVEVLKIREMIAAKKGKLNSGAKATARGRGKTVSKGKKKLRLEKEEEAVYEYKRKPRVLSPVVPEPPELIHEDDKTKYLIEDWGVDNLRPVAKKGFLGGKSSKSKEISEILSFSKKPIEASLLKLDTTLSQQAVSTFNAILDYQSDKGNPSDHVNLILDAGWKTPALRDEIYLQIIKQTKNAPSKQLNERAWQLLALCTITFPPSTEFLLYVAYFLSTSQVSLLGEPGYFASFCLKRLRRGLHVNGQTATTYQRKLFPSTKELETARERNQLDVAIHLPDGTSHTIDVDNGTTALEVLGVVVGRISLKDATEWALYEIHEHEEEPETAEGAAPDSPGRSPKPRDDEAEKVQEYVERSMDDNDLLVEVFCRQEQLKSKVTFLVKRKLFLNPQSSSDDPVEKHLLAHQVMSDVVKGLILVDEETALKLASLKWRIDRLNQQEKKSKKTSKKKEDKPKDSKKDAKALKEAQKAMKLDEFLPAHILKKHRKKTDGLKKTIVDQAQEFEEKNLSREHCETMYLDIVKKLPLYGYKIFPCSHKSEWKLPEEFEIAIGVGGIIFLNNKDKETLCSFGHGELSILSYNSSGCKFHHQIDNIANEIELLTSHGSEIFQLVRDYGFNLRLQSSQCRAIADYEIDDKNLLSFQRGDIITVIEKDDQTGSGWYLGMINKDKKGKFPADLVEIIIPIDSEQAKDTKGPFRRTNSFLGKRSAITGKGFTVEKKELKRVSSLVSTTRYVKKDKPEKSSRSANRRLSQAVTHGKDIVKVKEVDQEQFVFTNFAQSHFRKEVTINPIAAEKDKKGIKIPLGTMRGKKPQVIHWNQRVFFEKEPIHDSLLDIASDEMNQLACEIFLTIMKYMEDYPCETPPAELVQDFVQKGIQHEILRDEIYCQLIKQTKENPRLESKIKGWELFVIVSTCFSPSAKLENYVIRHAQCQPDSNEALIVALSKETLQRLERTKGKGGKIYPPSTQELDSLIGGEPMSIPIYLADGSKKAIEIDSASTIQDVKKNFIRHVLVPNHNHWCLFDVRKSGKDYWERPVLKDENIGDILSKWEQTAAKLSDKKDFEGKLVYKKFLFNTPPKVKLEEMTSPKALSLLWKQCVTSVLQARQFISKDDLPTFVALHLQIENGDFKEEKWTEFEEYFTKSSLKKGSLTASTGDKSPRNSGKGDKSPKDSLKSPRKGSEASPSGRTKRGATVTLVIPSYYEKFIPRHMLPKANDFTTLLAKIKPVWQGFAGTFKTPELAKERYISKLREAPLFGSIHFPAEMFIDSSNQVPVSLVFSRDGVSVLEPGKMIPTKTTPYSEISSFFANKNSFTIVSGDLLSPDKEMFVTEHGEDMKLLFQQYQSVSESSVSSGGGGGIEAGRRRRRAF